LTLFNGEIHAEAQDIALDLVFVGEE
jgi:hypothetical protein